MKIRVHFILVFFLSLFAAGSADYVNSAVNSSSEPSVTADPKTGNGKALIDAPVKPKGIEKPTESKTVYSGKNGMKNRASVAERYYREGVLAYIRGDYTKALSLFKRVLEIHPDHVNAKSQIEKIKQETDAKKLKQAKDMYNEGVSLYMNGQIENAISLWEGALKLDQYNPNIQRALDRARSELREKRLPEKNPE